MWLCSVGQDDIDLKDKDRAWDGVGRGENCFPQPTAAQTLGLIRVLSQAVRFQRVSERIQDAVDVEYYVSLLARSCTRSMYITQDPGKSSARATASLTPIFSAMCCCSTPMPAVSKAAMLRYCVACQCRFAENESSNKVARIRCLSVSSLASLPLSLSLSLSLSISLSLSLALLLALPFAMDVQDSWPRICPKPASSAKKSVVSRISSFFNGVHVSVMCHRLVLHN